MKETKGDKSSDTHNDEKIDDHSNFSRSIMDSSSSNKFSSSSSGNFQTAETNEKKRKSTASATKKQRKKSKKQHKQLTNKVAAGEDLNGMSISAILAVTPSKGKAWNSTKKRNEKSEKNSNDVKAKEENKVARKDEKIEKKEYTPKISKKNEINWNKRYNELRKYQKLKGGPLGYVSPSSKDIDPSLAKWCENQRYFYGLQQKGKPYSFMNEERIQALESIGFLWKKPPILSSVNKATTLSTEINKSSEDNNSNIKVNNLDCPSTSSSSKTTNNSKKSGKRTEDNKDNFSTKKSKRRQKTTQQEPIQPSRKRSPAVPWEEKFKQLVNYQKSNPNNGWFGYTSTNITRGLAKWCENQRYTYRLRKQSSPLALSDDKVKMLESIGFLWEKPTDYKNSNQHQHQETTKTQNQNIDKTKQAKCVPENKPYDPKQKVTRNMSTTNNKQVVQIAKGLDSKEQTGVKNTSNTVREEVKKVTAANTNPSKDSLHASNLENLEKQYIQRFVNTCKDLRQIRHQLLYLTRRKQEEKEEERKKLEQQLGEEDRNENQKLEKLHQAKPIEESLINSEDDLYEKHIMEKLVLSHNPIYDDKAIDIDQKNLLCEDKDATLLLHAMPIACSALSGEAKFPVTIELNDENLII